MKFELLRDAVVTNETSKNNKVYQVVELTYKDLFNGAVKSKKLPSFEGAFGTLKAAKQGEKYNITTKQNGKFWNWESAELMADHPGSAWPDEPRKPQTQTARSNFETPEERARRQVYIVRQSSLSTAVALLTHNNPKGVVDEGEVILLAENFTKFVMSVNPISTMSDDIPE